MNIPIVVVAYNREKSLERLLNALANANYANYKVDLIISIDKSHNSKVTNLADSFEWIYGEKKIIKHNENLGLRKHILSCGDLVKDYDAIIMLEDDLLVSKSFYLFSQQSVAFYAHDDNIGGISLYNYPVSEFANFRKFTPMLDDSDIFFMNVPSSWGQIWTKKQWESFRLWYEKEEYKNFDYTDIVPMVTLSWSEKSWKKYFHMYTAQHNKQVVYPRFGYSTNMGDMGTHNEIASTAYQTNLMGNFNRNYHFKELSNSECVYDAFMENKKLFHAFDLDKELIVDYYGIKNITDKKDYLLTTRVLNYKILKTWGLSLKPYEQNIIFNISGNDLFLYDLAKDGNKKIKKNSNEINLYKYDLPGIDRQRAIKVGISEYKQAIVRKYNKYFKK